MPQGKKYRYNPPEEQRLIRRAQREDPDEEELERIRSRLINEFGWGGKKASGLGRFKKGINLGDH